MENDQLYEEINSLITQAKWFRARRRYPEAIEEYQKAVAIVESTDHLESRNGLLEEWGWQLFEVDQFEAAAEIYNKCVELQLKCLRAEILETDQAQDVVCSALNFMICLANLTDMIWLADEICEELLSFQGLEAVTASIEYPKETRQGLWKYLEATRRSDLRAQIQELIPDDLSRTKSSSESIANQQVNTVDQVSQHSQRPPNWPHTEDFSAPIDTSAIRMRHKDGSSVSKQTFQHEIDSPKGRASVQYSAQGGESSGDYQNQSQTSDETASHLEQDTNAHLLSTR
jgi:tetratricopeptide (TPR) repeat protein